MKNDLKNISWFKWNPTKDLWALSCSYLLVVASLSAATYIVTGANGIGYFLTYGILTALIIGIGFPVIWTVFVNKQSTATLGFTKKNLVISLIIQVTLSGALYLSALAKTSFPAFETLAPLIALTLAIGFFEAIFWRGWVLLRLEEAFGLLPALILGSILYSAYHIGYGMQMSEMVFLFFIGLMFAIIFRLTKNIFILWPLFQPMGQLITLLKENLPLPMIAVLGFLEVLVVMMVVMIFTPILARKKGVSLKT